MISRDGSTTSLWQSNAVLYHALNGPAQDQTYDVIIIGGGITGVTTALRLQEAGKQCLLLEAATLCFGTTGGTTAHLNTLVDTSYPVIEKDFGKDGAKLVASYTAESIQLIRNNISKYDIQCGFKEADAYVFAQEEHEVKQLEEMITATGEAGLEVSEESDLPVPFSFLKCMKVGGQAQFSPAEYVYALAQAFEKAGGVIVQHCRVTNIHNTDIVEVEAERGTFKCKDMVYATHIPPGINLLHLRCAPYRSYALAARLRDNKYPHDLSYDMKDPYHYYRTQEINNEPYLIVGGNDHKTGHHENTLQSMADLRAHVRQHFDVSEIAYEWSSQLFEPVDGLPYIGHLPGHKDHVYVATGFSGNGMVYSGVAAIIINDLILGRTSAGAELFSPKRIKPVAGFTEFVQHNATVVKEFAEKIFSREHLQQLAALAPGEGKVVIHEKHKIALHKDDAGNLHAVKPACTHMKCDVSWNAAERSWDCPCHGARYDCDGKVLTGPASFNLEPVSLTTHQR